MALRAIVLAGDLSKNYQMIPYIFVNLIPGKKGKPLSGRLERL